MKVCNLPGKQFLRYRCNPFNPQRQTLVLVHGVSGSSGAWLPYETHFEDRYNIVSLDLRGHGYSFRPQRYADYTIANYADDVYRVVNELGVRNFILIGHSFGATVVMDFLRQYQDLAQAAIFISPDYRPGTRLNNKAIRALLSPIRLFDALPIHTPGGYIDYHRHFPNAGDWHIGRFTADVRNSGLKGFLATMHHFAGYDATPYLPLLTLPAQIIHGQQDTLIPVAAAHQMLDLLPNAELEIFEMANHIIVVNYFDLLAPAIDHFAQRQPQPR